MRVRLVWTAAVFVSVFIALYGGSGRQKAGTQAQAATAPAPFKHTLFDEILQAHVKSGKVDYQALKAADAAKLRRYLQQLATADPKRFATRDDALAFWLNAYNACDIAGVVERYPKIKSVQEVKGFFDDKRWKVAGQARSLDEIEGQIRSTFKDPRIHWILVCGAISCPPLSNRAMEGATVQKQLEGATRFAVNSDRYVQIDGKGKRLRLSQIMNWYKQDFVEKYGSLEKFLLRYLKEPKRGELAAGGYAIEFMPYDWALNDARAASAR